LRDRRPGLAAAPPRRAEAADGQGGLRARAASLLTRKTAGFSQSGGATGTAAQTKDEPIKFMLPSKIRSIREDRYGTGVNAVMKFLKDGVG
jgi:hypothetical protein